MHSVTPPYRRLTGLFFAVVCAALWLCALHKPATAFETTVGEVKFEVSGSANVRGEATRVRKRNRDTNNNEGALSGVLVVNGKASTERHAIITQLRPYMRTQWDPGSDHYSDAEVDELYWDGKLTDTFTTTAGRKQIVNGVALGYNPTDFLSHDKQVTGSNLTDVERRSERKGDNLVGASKYFENATIQGYLLFPNSTAGSEDLRGYAQFSHRLQPLQTDYTLSAYYDDYLQLGLNVASTLSHSVTGYVEVALAEKRGRKVAKAPLQLGSYQDIINQDGRGPEAVYADSAYLVQEKHSSRKLQYYDAVVGLQYTHESGVGLNVEYWRSNNAYSQSEFDDLWDNVEQGRIKPEVAEEWLRENNNVQRDKLFARISDIPLVDDLLSLEQTAILGLNDESFFSRTSLTWQATEASTARLNVNYFNGKRKSEFGMVPYEWQIYSSYKYLF